MLFPRIHALKSVAIHEIKHAIITGAVIYVLASDTTPSQYDIVSFLRYCDLGKTKME
jgi:hypothetical protein